MDNVKAVQKELEKYINPEKALFLPKFMQAFPGGYGEGDRFLGVVVPHQRQVARKFAKIISLAEIETLLQEEYHEYRLTALFLLIHKYQKAKDEATQQEIVDLYLRNLAHINNWDLVDSSADKILGPYLFDQDKSLLYELVRTEDLWKQRVAMMTTFYFIKQREYADALKMAMILLHHPHDLIHKAVGWMLREIGNRDFEVEYQFLKEHYHGMPRTMLRYAIEKFEEELRQRFLKGME